MEYLIVFCMEIRAATKKDVVILETIGKSIKEFQVDPKIEGFWSIDQLTNWVASKDDVCLLAEENGEVVGFALFAHHVPTGKVTWENCWVHQDHRGSCLVSDLTKEGLKQLKEKGATYICGLAEIENISSQKFLEKNGFQKGFDFVWLHRGLE